MILNNNKNELDRFLDANNDIYRILTLLNGNQELKKLLVYTDKKPLENPKDVTKDLRDKQISRTPILPYNEDEGSIIVVSLIDGDIAAKTQTLHGTLAIDVFTPGNQWIINEGIRPLQIVHIIDNLIYKDLKQTGGVRYRLTEIVTAQLSDVLLGYRMIFESVMDD